VTGLYKEKTLRAQKQHDPFDILTLKPKAGVYTKKTIQIIGTIHQDIFLIFERFLSPRGGIDAKPSMPPLNSTTNKRFSVGLVSGNAIFGLAII
jgi:hypothetical protein